MTLLLRPSPAHRYVLSFPTRRSSDLVFSAVAAFHDNQAVAAVGRCLYFGDPGPADVAYQPGCPAFQTEDRKSTRLNSSHLVSSYAVFCLKKKNKKREL